MVTNQCVIAHVILKQPYILGVFFYFFLLRTEKAQPKSSVYFCFGRPADLNVAHYKILPLPFQKYSPFCFRMTVQSLKPS